MTVWWQSRSERERRLMLIMITLALLVLAWLAVVQPLSDALANAKARYDAAAVALGEARARDEARRRDAGANAGAVPLPIDSLIGSSAAEAGFPAARIAGQGPARAIVAIDAARPQALFSWVARLERRGLAVEALRVRANPDRTVSAEMTLKARGS